MDMRFLTTDQGGQESPGQPLERKALVRFVMVTDIFGISCRKILWSVRALKRATRNLKRKIKRDQY